MATFQIPIANIDEDELDEFIEICEQFHHEVEEIVIRLEKNNNNMELVQALRFIFEGVLYSSMKLSLTPISESLDESVRCLDRVLALSLFPQDMTEFMLLISDRIQLMVFDAVRGHMLDIKKMQQPLVALSRITLCEKREDLEAAASSAIRVLTQDLEDELPSQHDVILFDEVEDRGSTEKDAPVSTPPILQETKNCILLAREFIASELNEHPAKIIAAISDATTDHGESHTTFLLELSLAINFLLNEEVDSLGLAVGICFHDIGLAQVPHILAKNTPLTPHEHAQIKKHPSDGFTLVSAFTSSETAHEAVLHHHERIDGRGYPYGLSGDEISPAGKIIAIADSFHAMTESRPHKKFTKNILRAAAEINTLSGTMYDPHFVNQFNTVLRKHWLPLRVENEAWDKSGSPKVGSDGPPIECREGEVMCLRNFGGKQ